MKFKHKLYHYQEDVLNTFDKEIKRGDKKIHIVAPPGSGKTIMGLEMISRLDGNHLILVPNITLQYQWKDKLEKMFLEEGEKSEDLISTTTDKLKKINIITYQSLTQSSRDNDLIYNKIIELWYGDIKQDFKSNLEFLDYIETLKELDINTYKEKISKYKKRLKAKGGDVVSKILSKKVLDYFLRLKEKGIKSIVVDEAHHLTNWWSKSIYYLWETLTVEDNSPFIIGLTATPPYEDVDFFVLDEDYTKLLGEVDYYVATPAVIKSGRLAPYSDLVYFVEPDESLKKELKRIDEILDNYIEKNKEIISSHIFKYIEKNYNTMLGKSYKLLLSYLKFVKTYSKNDISNYYFDDKIGEKITLQDIAKTIGKYIHDLSLDLEKNREVEKVKKIFYELGYIFRGRNFYRFRIKLEKMLVYGQSKMQAIKKILDKEISNLGKDLKGVIITDFLEEKDGLISCKYILKNLEKYKKLNPILVSGQGIWKLGSKQELISLDINILEVTKLLEEGKTKLLIGTKGILGEGWDCPRLNTLIDLTGIVAYMSVNQVRGRAIRLDKKNLLKVSNIYDIVTIYDSYSKDVDLYRLVKKHEQFYGVSDTGLIIKGVDHIYPNLANHIKDYKNINQNMLKRSGFRKYYYDLWGIGGVYENKEVFGLDLNIREIGNYIPYFRIYNGIGFFKKLKQKQKLEDISKDNYYFILIHKFLESFITNIVKTYKKIGELPDDFDFKILKGEFGNLKLVSNYKDDLIVKKFISDISVIFKVVSTQKYVLNYPFAYFDGEEVKESRVSFGLPDRLSKNNKVRKLFREELENDFSKSGLIINNGKLADLSLKTGIYGGILAGGFILETIAIMPALAIGLSIIGGLGLYLYPISLIIPIFYKNKSKMITQYNKLFKKFLKRHWTYRIKFIYLNSKEIDKDYYIGKKPFIESKIEKIWL